MKRLIRKAFGQTLFHATTLESLEGITASGMILPQETDGFSLGHDNESMLSDKAYEKATKEGLEDGTIEFDEAMDKYYEEFYEELEKDYVGYTFFTGTINHALETYGSWGDIKPVIEISVPENSLLPDDNDCTTCKTWQESLEKVNQVKVLGPITSDFIIGVHLFGPESEKIGYYSNLTWKEHFKPEELEQVAKKK